MYVLAIWENGEPRICGWYTLFSQATTEFSRMKSQYQFEKVSLYKVDLKFLTITLMGEE